MFFAAKLRNSYFVIPASRLQTYSRGRLQKNSKTMRKTTYHNHTTHWCTYDTQSAHPPNTRTIQTLSINTIFSPSVSNHHLKTRYNVRADAKGSHWLKKPDTDTYLPAKKIQKHRDTMFHDSAPAYRILLSASATWEWQLSQHRLCMRLLRVHATG